VEIVSDFVLQFFFLFGRGVGGGEERRWMGMSKFRMSTESDHHQGE
jgi:hypothetical protein